VKKRKFLTLLGFEIRPLGRPARSPSLYRLSYPGSVLKYDRLLNINNVCDFGSSVGNAKLEKSR
jgi:hypothetical protein